MCYNVINKIIFLIQITRSKLLLSIIFLIISYSQVSGQYGGNSIVRHIQGTSELDAGFGFSDLGPAVSGYYLWHINHQWFIKTGGTFEFDMDQRFNNRTMSLDLFIGRYLLAHRKFFMSMLIGPTIVFENLEGVDWEGKFLQPLPGGSLGFGLENYLSRRIAFTANGMIRMIPVSEVGKTRLYLLVGLKYTLKN
ncbi:MAG: hypothetical protein RLO17_12865 [Cyclobacteriaceae bacterium]